MRNLKAHSLPKVGLTIGLPHSWPSGGAHVVITARALFLGSIVTNCLLPSKWSSNECSLFVSPLFVFEKNKNKNTFAVLESGTHYRRFMEKDDPKNGGEFRQRFGVGSTRPMFKSTDERKRPFYLYVNHISPLTLVETLLITLS